MKKKFRVAGGEKFPEEQKFRVAEGAENKFPPKFLHLLPYQAAGGEKLEVYGEGSPEKILV